MALNPPLREWHGRRVWLVGASSGIGRATASALHAQGAMVIVSARSTHALDMFVAEHPGSVALPLDVTDSKAMNDALRSLTAEATLDCAVYCAGHYKAMDATEMDLPELLRHNLVNYVGALYFLDAVVPALLAQPLKEGQRGHISMVGSVAGYRGLPHSLAYGPTKAALINLCETLYLDLHRQGLGVSLINPGFVDTPLTRTNDFAMPALLSPDQAAQAILKGWARGNFEIHFPRRFTWGMKLLRHFPYALFFAVTRRLNP